MTKSVEELRAMLDEAEREGLVESHRVRRFLEGQGYDYAAKWLEEERVIQQNRAESKAKVSELVDQLNAVLMKYRAEMDLSHWSGCVTVKLTGISPELHALDFDGGLLKVKD